MAEADSAAGIVGAQALVAVGAVLWLVLEGWPDRLAAAVDAAARTGHDFDEIIVAFTALDRLDEASGLAETADSRTVQAYAAYLDLQLFEGSDLAQDF